MMDMELFQQMIKKQLEWRRLYNKQEKTRHTIRVICNRKYKSRCGKSADEIQAALDEYIMDEKLNLIAK